MNVRSSCSSRQMVNSTRWKNRTRKHYFAIHLGKSTLRWQSIKTTQRSLTERKARKRPVNKTVAHAFAYVSKQGHAPLVLRPQCSVRDSWLVLRLNQYTDWCRRGGIWCHATYNHELSALSAACARAVVIIQLYKRKCKANGGISHHGLCATKQQKEP